MARSDRHLRFRVMWSGAALTATVLTAFLFGWLDRVELGLYDLRATHFQHFTPKPTDKIVHLDIDDATLDAVGAWPWKRSILASLIDEMSAAGAKVIALDILYTEAQEKEWRKSLDGRSFLVVDHDAALADSFRRAGNVLLPASLAFVAGRPESPAFTRGLELLQQNLELSADQVVEKMSAEHFPADEIAEVQSMFFGLRREAAQKRAEAELSTIKRQPTTRSATRPLPAELPDVPEDVRVALRRSFFPHVDPRLVSPQARLADDAYDRALAVKEMERFDFPPTPGVSAFESRNEIIPLAALMGAAHSTAFVDYPNSTDGTVRSVPLFQMHRGKLVPQMGLRIACLMLDLDPADLLITPTSVTLPAGILRDGTPRRELKIPLRTQTLHHSNGKSLEMPLVMEIPWFGPRQWWAMYDPAHPEAKKQHVSLSRVYDILRTREKIEGNLGRVDDAATFLLGDRQTANGVPMLKLGPERVRAYEALKLRPGDVAPRLEIIDYTLKAIESRGDEEQFRALKPEEMSADEKKLFREMTIHLSNMRSATAELPKLKQQLLQQRQELQQLLAGKVAFVGWTATAAVADQKPTSLHPAAPGVVVHGVIVSDILTGDVWRMLPLGYTAAIAILLGLLTTLIVAYLSPVRALMAALLLGAGYLAINAVVLFDYGNLILGLAAPAFAISAAWAGGTITRLIIEARERTRITKRFASYVDKDLVNYVLETRDQRIFSGQRRDMAIVFTDLEGFTRLSEELGEEVVPLLNRFMGQATTVIKRHHGFVNKFLGDGILFFFNAPRPNAAFVPDAVSAVLDLQAMLSTFNEDLALQHLPRMRLRAGMTTGEVIVGDAGTEERSDYTVLGHLVNLAARLESANKHFGTTSLVTEPTVRAAGESFLFRPVGNVRVVGLQKGVMVYEAMCWAKDASESQKQTAVLTEAICEAFRASRPADCIAAVEKLEAHCGPSKIAKIYRELCEPYVNGTGEGTLPTEIVLAEK